MRVKQIMFWPVVQNGCFVSMPFEMEDQLLPAPIVNGLLAGIPFGAFCFAPSQIM